MASERVEALESAIAAWVGAVLRTKAASGRSPEGTRRAWKEAPIGVEVLFAPPSKGTPAVSSYGNEYLTSAFQSLISMKSSSIAISKTWRAPSRSPSSAVIELCPAQVHAAPRQLTHGSMVELPAGLR